jgi:hypothetical protein
MWTMVKHAAATFNGITIAYAVGFINAFLGILIAFGIKINPDEQAAIIAFVNISFVLLVHVAHRVGEYAAQQHPTNPPIKVVTTTEIPSTSEIPKQVAQ